MDTPFPEPLAGGTELAIPARAAAFPLALPRFLSEASSARPLAALRIGLAAVLLAQAAAIAPYLFLFFGERGIVQAPIAKALVPASLPRIAHVARLLAPVVHDERLVLLGCFALYVIALQLLLVGWNTRVVAIVAWLLHLTLRTTGTASAYGVFEFATIGLFYCSVMPVGAAWSMDAGSTSGAPWWKRDTASFESTLGLRMLQIHLCIVYLSSGIEKIRGEQWRNGEAIWRAVMRPRFAPFDLSWLAFHPTLPLLACWGTLALELGYAFFVWPRRTRRLWVLGTISMHAGIAVVLGLWSFSAVMIVLNAAAFLVPRRTRARAETRSPAVPS
ncbi:MAG: hypothetical protein JWO56_2751 [Acidobacteria bacterium]|nr:hypothetical protein [Acidobacteriota bacterium]